MMNESSPIGVIGFGVMGSSMALNLAKSGLPVLGYSRTASKVTALEHSGITLSSPDEIVQLCKVVLLSVSDGPAVNSILFGTHGIAPKLARGALIIDTTTNAPSEALSFATKCRELGLDLLDAPVTGGDVGARNATLTIMCGGPEETFQRALPFLNRIGKRVVLMGPSGSGQMMKAVNQVAVGLSIVAMTEALLLAERRGLNSAQALEILQGGAAGSWALSNYAPRLMSGDLKPGFDAAHMLKDLKIALKEAAGHCSLPGTETTTELFEQLVTLHKGVGNHALIKAYKN